MVSKSEKDNLAEPVVEIYNNIEMDLLMQITKRMSEGIDLVDSSNVVMWQFQQLQYLGLINQNNVNIIIKNTGIAREEILKAISLAGTTTATQVDVAMSAAVAAGATTVASPIASPVATTALASILLAFQNQALNTFNLVNNTLLTQAAQVYTDIINNTTAQVLAGTKTIYQAMRSTISKYAEMGIPALIDKAGRRWQAETYVRTVITSTMGNVANSMQDERMKEWGTELVEISSHNGARPKCAPYQGRIFSVSGNNTQYPNLYTDTSYGDVAGLFGINCGHIKYPFVEGISTQRYYPYPEAENDKQYQEQQKQRKLESSIRKAKLRKAMLENVGDKQGVKAANNLIRKRQEEMRKFIEETGRTRRREREQIVSRSTN